MALSGGALLAIDSQWVNERLNAKTAVAEENWASREALWQGAIDMFREEPLLGVGSGLYPHLLASSSTTNHGTSSSRSPITRISRCSRKMAPSASALFVAFIAGSWVTLVRARRAARRADDADGAMVRSRCAEQRHRRRCQRRIHQRSDGSADLAHCGHGRAAGGEYRRSRAFPALPGRRRSEGRTGHVVESRRAGHPCHAPRRRAAPAQHRGYRRRDRRAAAAAFAAEGADVVHAKPTARAHRAGGGGGVPWRSTWCTATTGAARCGCSGVLRMPGRARVHTLHGIAEPFLPIPGQPPPDPPRPAGLPSCGAGSAAAGRSGHRALGGHTTTRHAARPPRRAGFRRAQRHSTEAARTAAGGRGHRDDRVPRSGEGRRRVPRSGRPASRPRSHGPFRHRRRRPRASSPHRSGGPARHRPGGPLLGLSPVRRHRAPGTGHRGRQLTLRVELIRGPGGHCRWDSTCRNPLRRVTRSDPVRCRHVRAAGGSDGAR